MKALLDFGDLHPVPGCYLEMDSATARISAFGVGRWSNAGIDAIVAGASSNAFAGGAWSGRAEAIVEALNEAMRGRTALGKPLPVLVLETGRAIVDDAEVLVTRIVGGKRLPDGRRAARTNWW